jgi:hemoglobin
MENRSLYERLGQADGIARLVDGIVAAHMENPRIRARFLPYSHEPDRMEQIKGHLCAFLEAGSGGQRSYAGRTMRDAHRGMNINETEFVAALDDILGVLRQYGIDEQTQKDVLAIAYSLKAEILYV